jgi:hypothetical protein
MGYKQKRAGKYGFLAQALSLPDMMLATRRASILWEKMGTGRSCPRFSTGCWRLQVNAAERRRESAKLLLLHNYRLDVLGNFTAAAHITRSPGKRQDLKNRKVKLFWLFLKKTSQPLPVNKKIERHLAALRKC